MAVARLGDAGAAASSLNFTVPAGDDRVLIVCTGAEISTTTDVTAVSYGGQALTPLSEITAGTGFSYRGEIWYLLEAGIAAASGNTISVTYSNTPADEMIVAAAYEGVDQTGGTTTFPATAEDSTASSTPNPITTVDLTEAVGDAILAMVGAGNASSCSWAADLTEQQDFADASSFISMADRLSSTNGNVTIEGTVASQNRAVALSIRIAQLSAVTNTETHDTDARLVDRLDVDHSTDAILQEQDLEETHTADAIKERVTRRFKLRFPAFETPELDTGHVVRTINRQDNDGQITYEYRLLQGPAETVIASWNVILPGGAGSSWELNEYELSVPEAQAISDYGDLRIDVRARWQTTNTIAWVAWIRLFLPAGISKFVSHTTDAILQDVTVVELDHDTDAILQATVELTHSTDALLQTTVEATHTSDALLQATVELEHDADAILLAELELEHTADAILQITLELSHDTDSRLVDRLEVDHTADALLVQRLDVTHDTDARLVQVLEELHTTDATLQATLELSHTTSAILEAEAMVMHDTDALLKGTEELVHTADALLQSTLELTHDTDGRLVDRLTATHTADALLQALEEVTHTADARLVDVLEVTHDTDAVLTPSSVEVVHTTDALLAAQGTPQHTADAVLQATVELEHDTDALLQAQLEASHDTDALLLAELDASHTTDARIILQPTAQHTADAILELFQYAYPVSDIATGDWESAPTPAQPLYQQLDEYPPDDADYIWEELP